MPADFLNVSITKFVESRAYEESIEETNQEDKESKAEKKTKQEKESELLPKRGIEFRSLSHIFQAIYPNDSDCDYGDVVLGAFMKHDFVGVQDEASD